MYSSINIIIKFSPDGWKKSFLKLAYINVWHKLDLPGKTTAFTAVATFFVLPILILWETLIGGRGDRKKYAIELVTIYDVIYKALINFNNWQFDVLPGWFISLGSKVAYLFIVETICNMYISRLFAIFRMFKC